MRNCVAKNYGSGIGNSSKSHRTRCAKCWLSCVIPVVGTEAALTALVVYSTTPFSVPIEDA